MEQQINGDCNGSCDEWKNLNQQNSSYVQCAVHLLSLKDRLSGKVVHGTRPGPK